MPVYVHNLQGVQYTVPVLVGPVVVEAAGTSGSVKNITSEIENLSPANYATLQVEQDTGLLSFSKTPDVVIEGGTPGLMIGPGISVNDQAKDPRTATLAISALNTPSYFNCLGQPVKTVQIINPSGAFELEIWGSIDNLNPAFANKQWVHRSTIRRSAGATIHNLREDLIDKIDDDQFLRFELIRGAVPLDVLVRTTF
jgi:hypothetical protein